MLSQSRGRVVMVVVGCAWLATMVSCTGNTQETAPPEQPQLQPVISLSELMSGIIDPASDRVFDAVRTEVGPQGVVAHLASGLPMC